MPSTLDAQTLPTRDIAGSHAFGADSFRYGPLRCVLNDDEGHRDYASPLHTHIARQWPVTYQQSAGFNHPFLPVDYLRTGISRRPTMIRSAASYSPESGRPRLVPPKHFYRRCGPHRDRSECATDWHPQTREWAVNQTDDFAQANLRRCPAQPVSALGPRTLCTRRAFFSLEGSVPGTSPADFLRRRYRGSESPCV